MRWARRLADTATIVSVGLMFVLMWMIGLRTAAVALTLGGLIAFGSRWAWTRLRDKLQSRN
ncbi:hypothetical protein ACWEPC_34465 [Nonomuraea sp. NPDC004297]